MGSGTHGALGVATRHTVSKNAGHSYCAKCPLSHGRNLKGQRAPGTSSGIVRKCFDLSLGLYGAESKHRCRSVASMGDPFSACKCAFVSPVLV